MLRTQSRPITTLVFVTVFLLSSTSASHAEFYKGDDELNPCASAAAALAACGAGSAALCVSRGGGDAEFAGCYRPQPTIPTLPEPPAAGGGTAPPTEPGPNNPVEELDRGYGDAEEMQGKECRANPIEIGSGNKYQAESDYVGPGALPLRIARHYNSKGADWSIHRGLFGAGWTSNFEEQIVAMSETAVGVSPKIEEVIVQNETGHRFRLTSTDDGPWLATNGREVVFQKDDVLDRWIYLDGTTVKTYGPKGHIESVTHENGEHLIFEYDEIETSPQIFKARLASVTHSSGAQFTFTYDVIDRIATVTDSESNVYTYTYTGYNLTKASLPGTNGAIDEIDYKYEHFPKTSHLTGKRYLPWPVNFATWNYNDDGLVTSSEHGVGINKLQVAYDSDTPTTVTRTTTNEHGKQTTLTFTKTGGDFRSTSVSGAAHGTCLAATRSSTYDANGYHDLVTDREGNVTDYDYDWLGELQQVVTGVGTTDSRTITFDWNSLYSKPEKITTALSESTFTYDSRGRPLTISVKNTSPNGVVNQTRAWSYTYEEYPGSSILKKVTIDGPRTDVSDVTDAHFDANGLLTSTVSQVDAQTTLTTNYSDYDAMGRVGKVTYPSGLIREYDYDPRGRVIEVKDTNGAKVTSTLLEYHMSGDTTKVTFADGLAVSYGYDTSRRLTTITYDDGDTDYNDKVWRKFTYDVGSNVVKESALERALGWVEDLNCGDEEDSPFPSPFPTLPGPGCGGSFEMTNVVRYDMDFTYDSLNRQTKQIFDWFGRDIEYYYDKSDRVVEVRDPKGGASTYSYNAHEQLDQSTARDGGVVEIDYDDDGQTTAVRNALSQWTNYTVDGFGQAVRTEGPDGKTNTVDYEYDSAGNVTRETDARGVFLDFEYDALNRLLNTYVNGSTMPIHTYEYDTDRPGYLYRVTDEAGTHTFLRDEEGKVLSRTDVLSGATLTTSYAYDSYERLSQITYPSGLQVNYVYDSLGRIEDITASGGGLYGTKNVVTGVTFYPLGAVRGFTFGNGEVFSRTLNRDYEMQYLNSGPISGRLLQRDLNGNITSFDSRTFTYDEMDRLESHAGPDLDWEYSYDLNGNREWHKYKNDYTYYAYDSSKSHLETLSTVIGSATVTESRSYDANGNTIQIDNRFFDHNDLNRLWRYRDGALTVTYTHNAFGERQIKDDGSTVTRFVYSGPNLLHEQAGTTKRDYIYLDGEMVGMVKNGVLYSVHNDHLGRPEIVTNPAKAVVWSGQNNAFGNTPGTDLIGNFNVGFPGQYYDVESGTYYNYFRTYDGLTGRYMQSDPAGLADGPNTYTYAASNPVAWVDPFGLGKTRVRNPGNNPYSGNMSGSSGGNRIGVSPETAMRSVNLPNSPLRAPSNAAQDIARRAIAHSREQQRQREEFLEAAGEAFDNLNDFMELSLPDDSFWVDREKKRKYLIAVWWDNAVSDAEACTRPDVVERSRRIPEMWPL